MGRNGGRRRGFSALRDGGLFLAAVFLGILIAAKLDQINSETYSGRFFVIDGDTRWTYAELDARADSLAAGFAVPVEVEWDQITLPGDLLGDARPFLQDGMQVALELWDEKPISVELPAQIEATIVEADAVVKGQTASSSYKPAILDNGVRIMVPPHIGSGTRIIVDVYEQAYVGKAG